MKLDHAVLWDRAELGRSEQQNIGHHPEIRFEVGKRSLRLLAGVFGKAMDRQPAFLGRDDQRVGSGPGSLGRRKNSGDLVPARGEGLEHGLAKGLLTDDDDAHVLPSNCVSQAAPRRSDAVPLPKSAQFHAEVLWGKSVAPARSDSRAGRLLGNSNVTVVPMPTWARIET